MSVKLHAVIIFFSPCFGLCVAGVSDRTHDPLNTRCAQRQPAVRSDAAGTILEESLIHERKAQEEVMWLMRVKVLDAVQWCSVALALHPLHCDLVPLLHVLASLPL